MGKSTISMVIFNSKLLVYQRVTCFWEFCWSNPLFLVALNIYPAVCGAPQSCHCWFLFTQLTQIKTSMKFQSTISYRRTSPFASIKPVASGYVKHSDWTYPIYSGFTYWTWWIFPARFLLTLTRPGTFDVFRHSFPIFLLKSAWKSQPKPTDLRGIGLGVCTITWRHGDRDFTSRQEVRFERRTPRPSESISKRHGDAMYKDRGELMVSEARTHRIALWPGSIPVVVIFFHEAHEKWARLRYRETFFFLINVRCT